MPDILFSLHGIFLLLITCCLLYGLFARLGSSCAIELSIATAPAAMALLLQIFLLTIPGAGLSTYRFVLTIAVLLPAFIWLLPSIRMLKMLNMQRFWLSVLLCCILSLPLFLFIRPVFSSFDPANYYLIGKTFLQGTSIMDYPFVDMDRTTHIFSWFAHPPLFPCMHSYFMLFRLDMFSPYISVFYSLLLMLLVIRVAARHANLAAGILICVLLLVTPVFVRTSILGFTAPLRMFFFAALFVVLGESDKRSYFTAGIVAGLTMHTHTLGILALPGAALAHILINRKLCTKELVKMVGIGLLIGSFWYGWNLWKLGSLDTTALMTNHFTEYVSKIFQYQFHQEGMDNFQTKMLRGALGPFTRMASFGLSFWIGSILLIIIMIRKKATPLFWAAAAMIIVYAGFHLMPVRYNISWLSDRYPLTILPVLLIGTIPLLKSRALQGAASVGILVSGTLVLGFHTPYYKEPDHYGEMQKIVQSNVHSTDKVLVVHSPYFFVYNAGTAGVDSIDPRLSHLYHMCDLNDITEQLENSGFTHLLMPWAPGPFETDSFIRKLFITEGLLQPVGHTRSFYLYRFDYSAVPESDIREKELVRWPAEDKLQFLAYSNEKGVAPPRIWMTGKAVHTFAVRTGGTLAIASAPLWEQWAGIIDVENCDSVQIRLRIRKHNRSFTIHPIMAMFNENGDRIRLLHPVHFETVTGWTTLRYATVYPHFMTERIPLSPDCRSISVGLSFFRESGGLSIEGIEVYGYQY